LHVAVVLFRIESSNDFQLYCQIALKNNTHLSKKTLQAFKNLPLQQVFSQIYQHQLWGTGQQPFYSGTGSHHKVIVKHSIDSLSSLIKKLQPDHILDIGCGDFNIGRQLAALVPRYTGVDIVKALIDYNRRQFADKHIQFLCIDACQDKLPAAELVIIRQVLQHLSNRGITDLMSNLQHHPRLVITEHIPEGSFQANKDKTAGPDNRLRLRSGVDLQQPPFNLQNYRYEIIGVMPEPSGFGGVLQTVLMEKL